MLLFLLRRIIRRLILRSALLLNIGATLLLVLGFTLVLAIGRALLLAVGQTLLLILASLLLLTIRAILLMALKYALLSGVGLILLLANDRRCFAGRRDLGLFRGGRLLGTPDGGRRKRAQDQDQGKELFHVDSFIECFGYGLDRVASLTPLKLRVAALRQKSPNVMRPVPRRRCGHRFRMVRCRPAETPALLFPS